MAQVCAAGRVPSSAVRFSTMAEFWIYCKAVGAHWINGYWYFTLIPDIPEIVGVISPKIGAWLKDKLDHISKSENRRRFSAWLIVAGLIFASYSAWDEQRSAAQTAAAAKSNAEHDSLIKALAIIDKMASSQKTPTISASSSITASVVVIPGWPALKPHTIEAMTSALAKAGKHEFDLFLCSSRDCDIFGNGFRTALLEASWHQRPNSVSQIKWQLPPGWVVIGYGDKAGMDALHDAIKEYLNVDVPTLNYPARPKAEPYVQFMIGPRPDNLLQLTP